VRRAGLLAIAMALGACNAAFGIDDTIAVPTTTDSDDDGVFDDEDNCIDVANPDQIDGDGDPLGDACDRCPGTQADSNHDEDLDGRPDGCDDCPGLDNFVGDTDQDGVGDACDGDSHATARVLFDPFIALSPAWHGDGEWSIANADSLASAVPVSADTRGLEREDVMLGNDEWSIAMGITSSETWSLGDRAGIRAVGADGSAVTCTVECTTIGCDVTLVVDGLQPQRAVVFAQPFVQLQLSAKNVNAGTNAHGFTCASGGQMTYLESIPTTSSWHPALLVGPKLRASYLEILQ
jgi:hypothetical protein